MDINSTNATTEQSSVGSKGSAAKARRRRKVRKAFAGALALLFALTGAGFLANALTPDAQNAVAEQSSEELAKQGKELYEVACITCHGGNLQGVKDRGPSLIGVGEGAVYFQVHSGRMPMLRNEAQTSRKNPRYSEQQALALAAYVNATVAARASSATLTARLQWSPCVAPITRTARSTRLMLPVVLTCSA